MGQKLRIAVVGAGLIGRQHAQRVRGHPHMELADVVDPLLQPADAAFGPGTLGMRTYKGKASWWEPFTATALASPRSTH